MELFNLEKIAVNQSATAFEAVRRIKEDKGLDYQIIYAYHVTLSNLKEGFEIFDDQEVYLSILCFLLTGKIKNEITIITATRTTIHFANLAVGSSNFLIRRETPAPTPTIIARRRTQKITVQYGIPARLPIIIS